MNDIKIKKGNFNLIKLNFQKEKRKMSSKYLKFLRIY